MKKLLKWTLRILYILLTLITLVLVYYNVSSLNREVNTVQQAAPESGQLLALEGVEIFFQELGPADGTPVILIHGTGSWSEIWRETMIPLAGAGYRAIAIDLPPFGYSGKPAGSAQYSTEKQGSRINALLDKLEISKAIFVGHSVGGRATLDAVLNNMERVERLVLVDAALGFSSDSVTYAYLQNDPGILMNTFFKLTWLRNSGIRAIGTNPAYTQSLFESFVFNKEAVTEARVKMLQEPFSLKGFSRSNADWLEYLTIVNPHKGLTSNFANFNKINCPTLLIWGDKDNITPLWQGKALHKILPNSKLHILHDTGHIPYIEDTEAFNDALLSFLMK